MKLESLKAALVADRAALQLDRRREGEVGAMVGRVVREVAGALDHIDRASAEESEAPEVSESPLAIVLSVVAILAACTAPVLLIPTVAPRLDEWASAGIMICFGIVVAALTIIEIDRARKADIVNNAEVLSQASMAIALLTAGGAVLRAVLDPEGSSSGYVAALVLLGCAGVLLALMVVGRRGTARRQAATDEHWRAATEAAAGIERAREAIVGRALVGLRPGAESSAWGLAVDALGHEDAALARLWRQHGAGALIVWDASDPAGDAVTDARARHVTEAHPPGRSHDSSATTGSP